MIYIKNNTKTQRVYLPKEDGIIRHSGGGGGGEDCDYCYNVGYEDGLADGEDKQKKRLGHLDATENGEYENANSGWSSVTVTVPQTGHTQQEIDDAYNSGITYQKSLLGSTAITTNTTVVNGNGWSAVTVNVPDRYSEGYSDGEAHQKSLLSSTAITENGEYTSENGFDEVSVNVPSRYNDGYADGVAHQKSLLTTTAVTENGTYTSENGFSEVEVTVPQPPQPLIEHNKPYTATTNGTSSITPSDIWSVDCELFNYNRYIRCKLNGTVSSAYYGTVAYKWDWHHNDPYLGYFLLKINAAGDDLELDDTNFDTESEPYYWYKQGEWWVFNFRGSPSASNLIITPQNNKESYDAMDSVALTVSVDMTEAKTEGYNSGYTAGQESITSTFTSLTVNQNGNYGSSAQPITALTVQVGGCPECHSYPIQSDHIIVTYDFADDGNNQIINNYGESSPTGDMYVDGVLTSLTGNTLNLSAGEHIIDFYPYAAQTVDLSGITGVTEVVVGGRYYNLDDIVTINDCTNLKKIVVLRDASPITATASSFIGLPASGCLYVPTNYITSYENDTVWGAFLTDNAWDIDSVDGCYDYDQAMDIYYSGYTDGQQSMSQGTLVALYCNWATFDFPLSPLGESVSLLSANIGFSGSSTPFARIAGGASSAYTDGMPNYIIAKITGNSLSGITASDSGTTTITPTMFPSGDDLYFNKNNTYKVGYGSSGVYQLVGTTFNLNAWHLYMNGYLFNVCNNGQYKCYYPYVDYQGRAALMYNGNVIYPTSGSVYPVYYDSASNQYYVIRKDTLTV